MPTTLAPARIRLEDHPLYGSIRSLDDLRIFMESHVFAVWDFMSLLKSLQASLTCVEVPWLPSADPESRRLINEIVLGEESDEYQGRYLSHFELYLEAMREVGADTLPVTTFLDFLRAGETLESALLRSGALPEAQAFVSSTFAMIRRNQPHIIAAAFTHGREDLIPAMFRKMVQGLGIAKTFEYYLERHIEVDGDSHGPMALRMLSNLCGGSTRKEAEAESAANDALEARIRLWDAIHERIVRKG